MTKRPQTIAESATFGEEYSQESVAGCACARILAGLDTPSAASAPPQAAAIAWVEQWYATPETQPPGFWDALEALLMAHPLDFGSAAGDGSVEPPAAP